MQSKSAKRILTVTVRRMLDDSPDTSYLGEYGTRPNARMESLNSDQWCYLGVRAEAEVTLTGDNVHRITSGGVWGIESDSGHSHFEEIEREELAQLRDELHAIGFSKRAITAAFRNVEHQSN